MSPPGALERLERVLVMVPWLLDRPGVSVDEVTERFDITADDLAADLDVLGYCGLPGYGGGDLIEASLVGDRVVVRMADAFRRPLRLSRDEALTLLLAARAVAGAAALPESEALRTAVRTLEDALHLDDETPQVTVDLTAPGDEHLPGLREAVADRRVVRMSYRSGSTGEERARVVEPWAVTGHLGAWYLHGYCRHARGPRHFRLDRIRDLAVTDEQAAAVPAEAASVPAYTPSPDDEAVTVDLDPDAWWVAEWAVVDDVADRTEPDGVVRRVQLRIGGRDWLVRLALAHAHAVRVVAPADLAEEVAERARATLARYEA